eukprot:33154-Pelagomonas_calceolata.AAC.1
MEMANPTSNSQHSKTHLLRLGLASGASPRSGAEATFSFKKSVLLSMLTKCFLVQEAGKRMSQLSDIFRKYSLEASVMLPV